MGATLKPEISETCTARRRSDTHTSDIPHDELPALKLYHMLARPQDDKMYSYRPLGSLFGTEGDSGGSVPGWFGLHEAYLIAEDAS